jgi:ubiquinone/menaquinone biosynthesis C-methylase UbiE
MSEQADGMRELVRERYAVAATMAAAGAPPSCCDSTGQAVEVGEGFGADLYAQAERGELSAEAVAASLGCGNPLAVAELRDGETVLDLGSGGGIDVLLSARRVGPTGTVYGLDMTAEVLQLARANAARAGATNAEFLQGALEDVPLPDASVDVIISNCVINLSTDKPAVFAEAFRVLCPGGRIGVSDVVAENALTAAQRAERGSYVGCIAGALSVREYRDGLAVAGFTDITITPTHPVAEGMHSAIIRAVKPSERRFSEGDERGRKRSSVLS